MRRKVFNGNNLNSFSIITILLTVKFNCDWKKVRQSGAILFPNQSVIFFCCTIEIWGLWFLIKCKTCPYCNKIIKIYHIESSSRRKKTWLYKILYCKKLRMSALISKLILFSHVLTIHFILFVSLSFILLWLGRTRDFNVVQ